MRHRYGLLVAAAVLAGGCSSAASSGPGGAPVASLSGHAGAGAGAGQSGQPLTQQQSDQDMISFTRCMRSHGVQMSDPVHRPGHAGLSIDLPTRDSATSSAYGACTHFIQATINIKMAGAASQAAPELPALTRYAQCMRGHGINLLDPTPQGQVNMGPGDFSRYSPQFRAADTACRHFLPAGIQDDGSGP